MRTFYELTAIIFVIEYGFGDLLTTYFDFLKYGWVRETDRTVVMIWQGGGWLAVIEYKILFVAGFIVACYLVDWLIDTYNVTDKERRMTKVLISIPAIYGVIIVANNLLVLLVAPF